jgi:microcystin-dependent protein
MPEPQTNNIGLFVPNTGDQVGTWGSLSLNPNSSTLDGYQAGLATIGASNAPITLTGPSGFTPSPSPGPTQSQNAVVRFTGTLTANVAVTFPLPGYYIVENLCSGVGSFYIQLVAAGGGNNIGAIPGKKCHVYNEGTNFDYVNMPDPGTAYDLHGWTTYPPWMRACTVAPYLIKDGTNYLAATYTNLYNVIGTTFGGTPTLNFNVPDERNRMRTPVDTNPGSGFSNRITTAGVGINGQSLNAAGGSQNQTLGRNNLPIFTINIPAGQGSHTHTPSSGTFAVQETATAGYNATGGTLAFVSSTAAATLPAMVTENLNNTGSQVATTTVPPALISFLPLIKT